VSPLSVTLVPPPAASLATTREPSARLSPTFNAVPSLGTCGVPPLRRSTSTPLLYPADGGVQYTRLVPLPETVFSSVGSAMVMPVSVTERSALCPP